MHVCLWRMVLQEKCHDAARAHGVTILHSACNVRISARRTPRTIDIDIVAYGRGTRIATRDLTLPHPRYREREFVLTGLVELRARELMRGLPRRQYRPGVSLERLGLG